MNKGKKIYEGKAKILYETDNPELLIQEFTDKATAFDAQKKGLIKDKGICNNKISARIFGVLEDKGIRTHFVRLLSEREMLVKRLDILPIEVTIRNVVAGGMAKLLGLKEGISLDSPVLEYHYKNDALHDPLINEYHIRALKIALNKEMDIVKERSFKINEVLVVFFKERDLDLVDFKLEFGRFSAKGGSASGGKGEIILGDEISPDTCRLWERGTGKKMDKDRFRRDLGEIEETYQEVLRRVQG